jgi:hypothetical protein
MTIDEDVREHVILGTDVHDIQAQKDQWLAENPSIRITEAGDIKREPPSLLVRFGGRSVPRFSMLLRYREEAGGPETTWNSHASAETKNNRKANR